MPKNPAPADPEIPTLPNTKQPPSAWPIPLAWKVFALVAVLLVVTLLAGLLFAINSPDNPDPSTQPLASTLGPDLSYPGATVLNTRDEVLWPKGRPNQYQNSTLGGLNTSDDSKQVTEFYRNKLTTLGYQVKVTICENDPCDGYSAIDGLAEKSHITLYVVSPKTLPTTNLPIAIALGNQSRAGQNLITYQYSSFNPSATAPQPDMSYPGAKNLNLTDADFWPNGRDRGYERATIGGYSSADGVKKITEFYKSKLEGLGYKVEIEMCWSGDCGGNADITASRTNVTVRLFVVDYPTLQAKSNSLRTIIKDKAIPGQSTILYAVNPVEPTPVTISVPPSPTATRPPTVSPVATSSVAYVGPDNRFYSDPATLVSLAPTGDIKGSDNVTFRVDWLVSDASGTRMQITVVGDQNKTLINDPIAHLEDGSGQKYLLKFDSNWVAGTKDIAHRQIVWKTDRLATTTTEVKFVPQAGFKFKLEPVKFKVAAISQTKAGSVKGRPAASDAHAGYRLSVPYANFDPERTALTVNFNVTDLALPPPLDLTHYDEKLAKSLTVRDDTGKLLNLLTTDALTSPNGMTPKLPLAPAQNGDMVVALDPIGANVKTITVRLEWQQQSWEVTLPTTP